MATITSTRAVSFYREGMGPAPVMLPFQASITAASLRPGEAVIQSTTGCKVPTTPNTVTSLIPLLGFMESNLSATTAALDLNAVSLALPHFIYEANMTGVNSQALFFIKYASVDDATNSCFNIDQTNTTNPSLIPFSFSNSYDFKIRPYIGATATSATAGQAMIADPAKGVLGDTNVRVQFTITPAGCVLAV